MYIDENLEEELVQKTINLEISSATLTFEDDLPFFETTLKVHLSDFWKISISSLLLAFSFFSSIIILTINFYFIGQFNDPALLGGIGLGNVWINSLGINTIYGLNYGFEIMASKAYGAKDYKQIEEYYKKGFLLIIVILGIFDCISFFTKKLFIFLGQDPIVSDHLQNYVIYSLPSLLFTALFDLRAIYLNAQEIFYPPVIIQIFTTISHIGWCTLFHKYEILGIALAMNINLFINYCLLEIYNWFWIPKKAKTSWGLNIFQDFYFYVKTTIPIGMTTVLEEFSYEINSIMAGLMGNPNILAAHVTLANIGALFYCLPEGFSTGINTYSGISMGEKKQFKAKRFAFWGGVGALLIISIGYFLLWVFQDQWTHLLTEHKNVKEIIKDTFYMAAIVGFLDTIQMSLGAVVKVTGNGPFALIMYFICLYIIANPLSFCFGITLKLGLDGIWLGIVVGLVGLGIIFFFIVLRINWKKEIELTEKYDKISF